MGTAETFDTGCRIAFGDDYDSPASAFFDVRKDSVRHWATGRRIPPPEVMQKLRRRLIHDVSHARDAISAIESDLNERGVWP